MSSRDKELVRLTCQDCGKEFELSFGRVRRLPADNHWRCKACQNIQRSLRYTNLTEEERKALHKQRSTSMKKTWADLSFDEYIRRCISQQKRWAKLSPEEKEEILKPFREGNKKYNSLPETKAALAQRNKERWNNMTPTERIEELQRLSQIKDDYWNSLTQDERVMKMMKMWKNETHIGPTEYIFSDFLRSIGMENGKEYYWGYYTYPYIHPKFFEVFGKTNLITNEENIPYHMWDFILFPNSEVPIVIDIDGSAHNPRLMNFKRLNNRYTERQKIDYNDSKRPYQIPDGIQAFIIQCHNDRLEDQIPVIHIESSKRMKYISFIELISNFFTQNYQKLKVTESSTTIENLRDSRNTVSM